MERVPHAVNTRGAYRLIGERQLDNEVATLRAPLSEVQPGLVLMAELMVGAAFTGDGTEMLSILRSGKPISRQDQGKVSSPEVYIANEHAVDLLAGGMPIAAAKRKWKSYVSFGYTCNHEWAQPWSTHSPRTMPEGITERVPRLPVDVRIDQEARVILRSRTPDIPIRADWTAAYIVSAAPTPPRASCRKTGLRLAN